MTLSIHYQQLDSNISTLISFNPVEEIQKDRTLKRWNSRLITIYANIHPRATALSDTINAVKSQWENVAKTINREQATKAYKELAPLHNKIAECYAKQFQPILKNAIELYTKQLSTWENEIRKSQTIAQNNPSSLKKHQESLEAQYTALKLNLKDLKIRQNALEADWSQTERNKCSAHVPTTWKWIWGADRFKDVDIDNQTLTPPAANQAGSNEATSQQDNSEINKELLAPPLSRRQARRQKQKDLFLQCKA